MSEVVGAFFGREGPEDLADCGTNGFEGSRGRLSQELLELGEDLLDWVQVRRIFGQKQELGAGRADERPYGLALVAAEIVHDDDVAGAKRGYQDPLDIGSKALAVDRPVE